MHESPIPSKWAKHRRIRPPIFPFPAFLLLTFRDEERCSCAELLRPDSCNRNPLKGIISASLDETESERGFLPGAE